MSSTNSQCPRFMQNAWKKDLCSNCFKSKEEHLVTRQNVTIGPTMPKNLGELQARSIIKTSVLVSKSKKKIVSFPKDISKVIGIGGEWSGSDGSDHEDDMSDQIIVNKEVVYEDDENLQRLTKNNTEFNMNNGNLLGDPAANIKRSFAALKLGAPQKDSAGKKQTLRISIQPFGNSTPSSSKSKIIPTEAKDEKPKSKSNGIVLKSMVLKSFGDSHNNSTDVTTDEIEKLPTGSAKPEKSLLEEISETLLSKRIIVNEATGVEKLPELTTKNDVIKVEIKNNDRVTSAVISSTSDNTSTTTIMKRSITRGNAITKDKEKPKIQVFPKRNEPDNGSDIELWTTPDNYNVTETRNRYENIQDRLDIQKNILIASDEPEQEKAEIEGDKNSEALSEKVSPFFSNESVSNMAHKPIKNTTKKRSESYDLMENLIVSSKITTDGLIVTKSRRLEETLDSSGSSFDSSSSDEELSNIRSQSDSEINLKSSNGVTSVCVNSVTSLDYKDIRVTGEIIKALKTSRILAGEPDGRSDPDGSSEPTPLLTQNPPPEADKQSFLHNSAKPKISAKPVTVSVVKPFKKRNAEIILQLEQVINKEKSLSNDALEAMKSPKKTRAPEPPQGETDAIVLRKYKEEQLGVESPIKRFEEIAKVKNKFAVKTNTVQVKETRQYPSINPKFRSLNHLNKSQETHEKINKFEQIQRESTTPEPAPRHSLSLSQDSLNMDLEKTKKKKFSIKKFLRMGSNKTEAGKKEYSHYADIPTSPSDFNCHGAPQIKPRLIIIHPLDINNTGVQVVNSASSASPQASSSSADPFVFHKPPPAPPIRADTTKLEINKPTRPPPLSNGEQRSEVEQQGQQLQKSKAPSPPIDNVYANIGEVRNSIAPRKPERTASMRDREAKELELQRFRPVGSSENHMVNKDVAKIEEQCKDEQPVATNPMRDARESSDSFTERKKKLLEFEHISTRSKIELFENNAVKPPGLVGKLPLPSKQQTSTYFLNNDGLKSSLMKMNVTIDKYLKNKELISQPETNSRTESRSPSPPLIVPSASDKMSPTPYRKDLLNLNSGGNENNIELRGNTHYDPMSLNTAKAGYQRASYSENSHYSPNASISNNVSRGMSYCGSDMGESEIYSPYSFCGSEAGIDVAQGDPNEGYQTFLRNNKTVNRLKLRKGRSVVHKNLEDNYSAVIVANHEALAAIYDQLQQPPTIPASLRAIANCINLRFEDFNIIDSIGLVVGKSVFHQAVWQSSLYVTLVLTSDSNQMVSSVCSELNQMSGGVSSALKLISEFCDLVPSNYLPSMPTTDVQMVQATITVLPKLNVETLESMIAVMKSKIQNQCLFSESQMVFGTTNDKNAVSINDKAYSDDKYKDGLFDDLLCREISFIMLQLVNGLKMMQSKGIEDMPLNLSNIIMCRELEKEMQARLCILQCYNPESRRDEEEEMGTLCECALKVVKDFFPVTKLTPILYHLLAQERSDTLSKVKSVLEYVLWGPADLSFNGPVREREMTLQRWLDLSRATALRSLAGSKIELTIYDECHLIFLIRSNSKTMLDASQVIAANLGAENNFLP